MTERRNCCICNGVTTELDSFNNFPIRFGMNIETKYKYENLIFAICNDCNNIQLSKLINIEDLYSNHPHNNNIIGDIWKQHFISYTNFIKNINNNLKNVLEIGSPNDKILKYMETYNTWTLLDPNVQKFSQSNIITINSFFDKEFDKTKKYDVIISSHLIEHLYEPSNQIELMNTCLHDKGDIFISVPNMEYYSKNHSPFLSISFEHTYYLNTVNMIYLLNKNGLEVINYEYYSKHSIFYHCKKNNSIGSSINVIKQYNLTNRYFFYNKINYFKTIVHNINKQLLNINKSIYIFGCHTNSQILIYFGLNISNIQYILDNDENKHNKYFYGTNLLCKSPNIIKDVNNPTIICYIGNYSQEVKTQLSLLNQKILFV